MGISSRSPMLDKLSLNNHQQRMQYTARYKTEALRIKRMITVYSNKPVLSLVYQLSTWCYPHLLPNACSNAPTINICSRRRHSAANQPAGVAAERWDRQTDGRRDRRPTVTQTLLHILCGQCQQLNSSLRIKSSKVCDAISHVTVTQ